ncbi:hypothetical protein [Chondrinema litorale]|uniref:hypothetical protein n=1 Tax=Chondrinema litorale TaxID=2994555 RepID=UPI00254324CA|nr:hypothetical protein [Chondrinema litorale]UZR97279.1 hypothetical protein OQ292_25600 [Chondrinema litorale]
MKNFLLSLGAFFICFSTTNTLLAQDDDKDGSKNKEKIVIKVNGEEHDFSAYISEIVESSVEKVTSSIDASFDDNTFNFSVDFGDESDWEAWGENLGKSIENMVNNMDIELTDIDPEDFNDVNFDNDHYNHKGSDVIRDIEKEYDSKVEKIEKMNIKIREEKVIIDMKARLENGKVVNKKIEEERDDN